MDKRNDDLSFLNLEGYIVATILWIVALVATGNNLVYALLVACIVILAVEKKSRLLLNHCSQLLILLFIAAVWNFIIMILSTLLIGLFGWLPIFGWSFVALIATLRWIFNIFYIIYAVLGLIKALQQDAVKLPIIYPLGDTLLNLFTRH